MKLHLVLGDITKLNVDAIVNAANERLHAGSGVCGAIHKAAGPELERECREIGFCATGDAVITGAYGLKAKSVIHTVGPKYREAGDRAPNLLKSCYENSLRLADTNALLSIAFPAIGTGVYGYPIEEATKIALKTVSSFTPNQNLSDIFFVCFSKSDYSVYLEVARENGITLET